MLSREVITRSGRGFRGNFPSRKLGRMVAGESLNELAAIQLLEFSPGVLSYREQPAVIQYVDGDVTRIYYPDFEVVFSTGEVIHLEIKSAKELGKPISQAKYRAIAAAYARRQHGFRILTDVELRQVPLQKNLQLLASLLHFRPEASSRVAWIKHFGKEHIPLVTVANRIGEKEVLRLIAWGGAHANLTEPLDRNALVHLIDAGGCDATYLF